MNFNKEKLKKYLPYIAGGIVLIVVFLLLLRNKSSSSMTTTDVSLNSDDVKAEVGKQLTAQLADVIAGTDKKISSISTDVVSSSKNYTNQVANDVVNNIQNLYNSTIENQVSFENQIQSSLFNMDSVVQKLKNDTSNLYDKFDSIETKIVNHSEAYTPTPTKSVTNSFDNWQTEAQKVLNVIAQKQRSDVNADITAEKEQLKYLQSIKPTVP